MPTLAQRLPYLHPFAGGFPYRGSQRLPSDPDALTYLAAVAEADGAPVEVGVATAVDDFFKGCKADPSGTPGRSNWDAIKASCILCGARTLAGALVPLVGTAPTNVADGFVEGDYTRGGATPGLKGDGTSYLDSGRAYEDDPQDSNHIALYLATINAQENYAAAGDTTVGTTRLGYFSSLTRYGVRTLQLNGPATLTPGFMAAGRSDESDVTLRYDDTSSTVAAASVSTEGIDVNYTVFVANYSNVGLVGYSSSIIAFYSIGEAVDLEALDARVTALVTAIGAAV
jgi:hypothetical protein